MEGGDWWAAVHGVAKSRTRLSDFTFPFHFHALKKEMATHSSVLAWRIPETEVPSGLPSMGSHRVGHNWSDLAAAAVYICRCYSLSSSHPLLSPLCPQVHSLWFHLYSCPTNRFICAFFSRFHIYALMSRLNLISILKNRHYFADNGPCKVFCLHSA